MAKYAFVAAMGEPALTVVDVTDPTSPIYVTSILTDGLSKLAHKDGILYGIAFGNRSLTCIEASITPSVLGHISGGGPPNYLQTPWDLVVSGNYCYISVQGDDGLTIINISNPNNPTYAGGIYGTGPPNYLGSQRGIAMPDSTHCCMTGWAGIDKAFNVIDVSNPANPVIIGQDRDSAYINVDMKISGDRAYMTNNALDLSIVDISDLTNPTLLSQTALFPNGSNHLQVIGNYAYVTSWWSHTLYIVDISNPLLPFVAGSIGGAGPPNYLDLAWGVYVKSNIAYVTGLDDNSLVLIDVSDPTNPTLLGVIRGSGAPNYLYAAEDVWVLEEAPPTPLVINKSYALSREEL
ncbi:hypothetical protein ES704_02038 [subsurface metagenome]